MNRARRRLTSVIESITMSERRIPYICDVMWWNSLHTYLVYRHTSKSSVKAVMSRCPTRWWEMKRSYFPSAGSTCLAFPVPVCFGAWEPLWSCCPVLATSLVDLLEAGDRKRDGQADNEEYDDNYEFRWKWWVWVNGWPGPFIIILSVLAVLLQVQHALSCILEYILHITYSADQAQRSTNP